MEIMDKAQERRLLRALEKAASIPTSSSDPDSAIAKAAQELKLTAPEACRVVEMFNKARSVTFMKHAMESERTNDFPLADSSKVVAKLYGTVSAPKSTFVIHKAANTVEASSSLSKVASDTTPTDRPGARLPEGHYALQLRDMCKWRASTFESMRKTASALKETMMDGMRKLAGHCENMSAKDKTKFSRNVVNAYGEQGRSLLSDLNKIGKFARLDIPLSKTATAVIFPLEAPYKICASLMKQGAELCKTITDCESFSKIATGDPDDFSTSTLTTPFVLDTLSGTLPDQHVSANVPVIDPLTGLKLQDARKLKQLLAAKQIHDLYISDPIIRSYPLHSVIKSINDIRQITPNMAIVDPWMRSSVRRVLVQGGVVDPVEIKDMLTAYTSKARGDMESSKLSEGLRSSGGSRGPAPSHADHSKKD
jgi:hypothetical protein